MANQETLKERLLFYLNPFDGRYEDLLKGNWKLNAFRDLTAGLVVAMVAIPLAMGFAMASGLRPEQGIVGGAIAGLMGALFGGSKYQVYGPTAAFIPVIAGLMATYNHSFLVLVSIISGALLMSMGLLRMGRIIALVPHSIVVGFTIGIAIVIAFSQIGEVLGIPHELGYNITEQLPNLLIHIEATNLYALALALLTFGLCKTLLKVSPFIPAPLIAFGVGLLLADTVWADRGLVLIKDEYGSIPTNFLVFTMPEMPALTATVFFDIIYFVFAIVFVAAIESLLCSRMADRLANNQGLPFNPNKELWGQGIVNIVTPLFNGFPHTGALARTAVNIKVGAISPLAGIAKFTFKLLLAAFLAVHLEHVPMACIGGTLLYVAQGMVKKAEIKLVESKNTFHILLMIFTAVMVPLFGFMIGVLSAIVVYAALFRFFDVSKEAVPAFVKTKLTNRPTDGSTERESLTEEMKIMDYYNNLLVKNREWVESKLSHDPGYFHKLSQGQQPPVFWIGCADSRVPANEITGTQSGEIFVHRNIANMVIHTDMNMLSVLDYAVNVLEVKHVIVCGHYGCGGVKAALTHQQYGLIDNWIRHIKDVYRVHQQELERIVDPKERENRFVEVNVIEQVYDLSKTSIIQNAWKKRGGPYLHGWVYDIGVGVIKDLNVSFADNSEMPEVYRFETPETR